jgi:hypothetical protein
MQWVLLVQLAATWFLVGLIWFVQRVHYPLFDRVERAAFAAFEREHQRRTTWVVAPPMLVELALAVWLACERPPGVPGWMVWLGLALVAGIWLSTALLQVPRHQILALGYEPRVHRQLVITNWLRTLAWSVRGLLAVVMPILAT